MNTITPIELATLAVLIAQSSEETPCEGHVDKAVRLVDSSAKIIERWRMVADQEQKSERPNRQTVFEKTE